MSVVLSTTATRRTVVGLCGAAAAALAGCDRTVTSPGPGRHGPAPTLAPADEADLAVLDDVRAMLAETLDRVRAVTRRHRSLRRQTVPLIALHRRHLATVSQAGETSVASPAHRPRIPQDPGAALTMVLAEEDALREHLVTASVRATSGPFARLLASMSAAVAQRASTLTGGR